MAARSASRIPDTAVASNPCRLFQTRCAAFEITPLQYSLLSALATRGTADQTTLAADVALDRTDDHGALSACNYASLLNARFTIEIAGRRFAGSPSRARRCCGEWRGPARAAHLETLADLSKADQKRFIAMMQRIVAASSDLG